MDWNYFFSHLRFRWTATLGIIMQARNCIDRTTHCLMLHALLFSSHWFPFVTAPGQYRNYMVQSKLCCTGWGDESWTAFCWPATATIGGLWAEILTKSTRRPSKWLFNVRVAVGGHQFPFSIAGRQLIAKSFARDRPFTKTWTGPSASRSLDLNMKKFLDDSLDLTWWQRDKKKWCVQNEQRI